MKLLFDENLPPSLTRTAGGVFAGSSHVLHVGLGQATDADIFRFAGKNSFTIVTNDDDFEALSRRFGPPPKIVMLRVGNASATALRACLARHEDDIARFIQSTEDQGVLVIGSTE